MSNAAFRGGAMLTRVSFHPRASSSLAITLEKKKARRQLWLTWLTLTGKDLAVPPPSGVRRSPAATGLGGDGGAHGSGICYTLGEKKPKIQNKIKTKRSRQQELELYPRTK